MEHPWAELTTQIKQWSNALGFSNTGICGIDLSHAEQQYLHWLRRGFHGEMSYMQRHGTKRTRPAELVPATIRVISVRMDYLPESIAASIDSLADSSIGYISRYALGRDYHKLIRGRLQQLAARINARIAPLGYRAFCDSAPVLEKPLAAKAGIGWVGKHSNLLNREAGSCFFLGELYVNIPLIEDQPIASHCGSCSKCIDVCPTNAIVQPFQVDARRCISYLTIELKSSIPVKFRKAIGNRIYGCDDCQLCCPWNQYASITAEPDFQIRHPLHDRSLTALFGWDESEFLKNTEGSAIRRIGYLRWLRNIAIALGNAARSTEVIAALQARSNHPSAMLREHVNWALQQHAA